MLRNLPYKKYLTVSFLFFAIFPLLPVKLLGLPVIIFFIATVISFFYNHKNNLNYKVFFIAIIPYLLFLVSALYSEDVGYGLAKVFETRLSLLIVPLSFFLLNKDSISLLKLKWSKFQLIYTLSSLLLSIIYILYLPFVKVSANPHFRFPSGFFFKSAASNLPYWNLEPVYFSLIIVVAFVLVCKLFHENKISKIYFFLSSFIFLVILVLMISKVAVAFVGLFLLWFLFYQVKILKYRIIAVSALALIAIYSCYKIPSINYEIQEIYYSIKGEKRTKDDSTDQRKRVTESAIELAFKVNPFFGTGIGDVQNDLNKIYEEKNYKDLLIKKYDAHNQFISMYLGVGAIGIIGLTLLLFSIIKTCINNQLIFILWIQCFFILQMFTETLLERQVPIILWSFITSFVLFLYPFKGRILSYQNK
ncbi:MULTISPECIES: O-antigen ligase family protein [Algibacter]|uniref:O-antigen ligase-like membrane protein n=2 Tax=Algibacter TaxID=261827 RepID=A0A4R8MA13_9FLAO|nr:MULTISPECIES: O-antigen ligase family protein [Algibacter]MDN3664915.1 O-antigen ligase family protein [Algibacter miyuki]MWW24431.1 hypothetical protein [Algibacter lectus]TDY62450.1 O-antigen ligase-like membrane protein [Algibacter lectus]